MSFIIETRNLCKKFPQPKRYRELILHPFLKNETIALEDINISVKKGELFGLLGPNGSGKTTLIKILSTLILPTKGKAYINGNDVTQYEKKVKSMIGLVVSDERSFYWRLTGKQNLLFFATLNNIPTPEAENRIKKISALIGLEEDMHRAFQNYSSGTRQKMAIARGLLTDPEVLFLDEPTRNLDPVVTSALRVFVKDVLVGQSGKTVFMATNNMQEAEELCDRIAIIQKGKVKQGGTLSEIRKAYHEKEQFIIKVKGGMRDVRESIQHSDYVNNLIDLQPELHSGGGVFLDIEIDYQKESISEFIEWLVVSGFKIESCVKQELSLNELFARSLCE